MAMRQTAVRPASPASRVVAWWLVVPALLLGVIAMHSMVSAPGQHADHGVTTVSAVTQAQASVDHAPEPADSGADLSCGAMFLMCLAVLLVAALVLLRGPARRWIERSRRHSSGPVVAKRPQFRPMPVLATISILRC